jgi:hypothetical protein
MNHRHSRKRALVIPESDSDDSQYDNNDLDSVSANQHASKLILNKLPLSIEDSDDSDLISSSNTCLEESIDSTTVRKDVRNDIFRDELFQRTLTKFNDFKLKYNASKAYSEAFKRFKEARYDIYNDEHRSRYIVNHILMEGSHS